MNAKFKTTTNNIEIIGVGATVEGGYATVAWRLLSETRSWGVQSLDFYVSSITIACDISVSNGKTTEKRGFNAKWSVREPNGWQVMLTRPAYFPADLFPRRIVVRPVKKEIEIQF